MRGVRVAAGFVPPGAADKLSGDAEGVRLPVRPRLQMRPGLPMPEVRMLQQLSVRLAPITNRAADYGPAVPVCCNVCRTCTTTNMVGLALGAGSAAAYAAVRFAKRAMPGRDEPSTEPAPLER